ncbi:TPA: D-xylose ABC transporter ATP-binding protein [Candidatus Sumerlaeota bacterium]|nr:D-xylose ABC transporter ATP-binding protein [Candidatus Sumerlaeota bacterium]
MSTPLLEVQKIGKQFPGVIALQDVDFCIEKGEVLALIGENGAGKSTLMKILAGVYTTDTGQILIDGQPVTIKSVRDAQALGVSLIHQELNVADNLDVAANLYLGREPQHLGVIDRAKLYKDAEALLKRAGFDLDPRAPLRSLSIGHQQLVEIAKAISTDARIIIMDEPTSSLSQHETEALFDVIRDLRGRGISIVYISHRLSEVKEVADRVVGLRDGRNAGALTREEISHESMIKLMVGRELSQLFPHSALTPGEVVLEVKNLRTSLYPEHTASFSLRAGEVVGVAGLVGAGRSEMLNALFGVDSTFGGEVRVAGTLVEPNSVGSAIRAGIGLVPEDRKGQGLVVQMSVRHNMSLSALWKNNYMGVLDRVAEKKISDEMIPRMSIKTPNDMQVVQLLSGGNQQKVVIGKWLALQPRVLLLDEPTRGIDVGAKREIYMLMDELAKAGVAILFVSSDLEEVMGMSDRMLVMHEGCIAGELKREELSEEAVMRLATGHVAA